jgi:hypothetical protein
VVAIAPPLIVLILLVVAQQSSNRTGSAALSATARALVTPARVQAESVETSVRLAKDLASVIPAEVMEAIILTIKSCNWQKVIL